MVALNPSGYRPASELPPRHELSPGELSGILAFCWLNYVVMQLHDDRWKISESENSGADK